MDNSIKIINVLEITNGLISRGKDGGVTVEKPTRPLYLGSGATSKMHREIQTSTTKETKQKFVLEVKKGLSRITTDRTKVDPRHQSSVSASVQIRVLHRPTMVDTAIYIYVLTLAPL